MKKSLLDEILMVMLAQLEGDLRGYMGVLDMANKIKRRKHLELRYSLRPHGSEHLL
jgi:hypothetical protein